MRNAVPTNDRFDPTSGALPPHFVNDSAPWANNILFRSFPHADVLLSP